MIIFMKYVEHDMHVHDFLPETLIYTFSFPH